MSWMYCVIWILYELDVLYKVFGLGTLTSELYVTPTKDVIASAVRVFSTVSLLLFQFPVLHF